MPAVTSNQARALCDRSQFGLIARRQAEYVAAAGAADAAAGAAIAADAAAAAAGHA